MKHAIYHLILAVTATTALARLGETPEECDGRYGTPVEYIHPDDGQGYTEGRAYLKNQIGILVAFHKEGDGIVRANLITYSKKGEYMNTPLTAKELHAFLDANAQGSTWDEIDNMGKAMDTADSYERDEQITSALTSATWKRSDKKAFARYDKTNDSLAVGTVALIDSQYKQKDPLEGF